MAIIGTDKYKLDTLLNNGPYKIPIYQRGYSWTKSELEEFIEDYKSLLNNDADSSNSHYLGQIVVHKDENDNLYIIDGQQRITTAVIFFSALREKAGDLVNEINKMPEFELKQELINSIEQTISLINATNIGIQSPISSTMRLTVGKSS